MMKTVVMRHIDAETRRRGEHNFRGRSRRLCASASYFGHHSRFSDCSRILSISDLGRQRQLRDGEAQIAQAAGLRQDGIGFAIHLLKQEIEAFADFALARQHGVELRGVGAQAHQFLRDIAAVGQQGGLLRQALRVDAGAVQQVGQLVAQTLLEGRNGAVRESAPCG